MSAMLELKNITKKFGGLTAVNDLSMVVNEHEIHALIADKNETTILEIIDDVLMFSITLLSSLSGRPEVIVAIGISLHFVSLLLKELPPLKTLISIWSSNIRLSLFTSPV